MDLDTWLTEENRAGNTLLHTALGLRVTEAAVDEGGLTLLCASGDRLRVVDDGQSCCEHRYVTCDDDVGQLVGGVFLGIRQGTGSFTVEEEDGTECHEVDFIEVVTTVGSVTLCTHNEHNGYYGGFSVQLRWEREGRDEDY